ncbi:MAG: serpin family protein [Oscillospiraceae bacterium]|nr:serpin family protein [Oscillospiraceae bacterium]
MNKKLLRACALALSLALLAGCAGEAPEQAQNRADAGPEGYCGFALELLSQCYQPGENTLVSPLSVHIALAMTAAGAKENTLEQMCTVLGMSAEEQRQFLRNFLSGQGEELQLANSIWFTDDPQFSVKEDFLQGCKKDFSAQLYRTHFDNTTAGEINRWVQEHTKDMIDEIVKEVPEYAVMYLINALAFEAQWESKYADYQVNDGRFTAEDGTVQNVELLHSTEQKFLSDDLATGFLKYYKGRQYAFAALLPNEGVTMEAYLESLTAQSLYKTLNEPTDIKVYAAIPKFETDFSIELSENLQTMGMSDAFDAEKADFTGIGTAAGGNIYISHVQHKTYFSLTEEGTRAGAATSVEMAFGAALAPEEYRTVTLDRPFVYMLIDCESGLPFFIGTMMSPNA